MTPRRAEVSRQRFLKTALAGAAALALSGCLAPKYQLPAVPVAGDYKEAAGHRDWTAAAPADQLDRGNWWTLYRDDTLDSLVARLEQNSPTLAAALARYDQARAYYDQSRVSLFPRLSLSGQYEPNRGSDMRPPSGSDTRYFKDNSLGLQASYEVDLWGRVRNSVKAGDASFVAAGDDLASAQLSLRAQLVDQYLQLRGLDNTVDLLNRNVDAFARALELTQSRRDGGIASGLDVARARTQLQAAKAQRSTSMGQRAVQEHAIAALIGESPSSFSIAPKTTRLAVPQLPTDVPSTLLQRRPDIAAAERRTAAANASVGVARAAWFPSLTLGGTVGYQSYQGSDWFKASNLFWSIGPSLALDLLDGGRRAAQVDQARALLDEAGARYRVTVLQAFAEVEDNLALLDRYQDAAEEEAQAVAASEHAVELATIRYRQGAVNYLEVTTAQSAALDAQRDLVTIDTERLRASVALIRALGGGWANPAPAVASAAPPP
ncbi:MAG: efflux transporter outer membrane subunit [Ferrovibrio sp.]|uniref:efflux transporter outer membrane subunit n=1 Tax=Ferrovibrio sp. TaxID=1917215 RepID=UPI002620413F|nr:efflux transporter outer membrane subunit [Ferrovibrio sp.]MCW0235768.1 efflux transporter outer membrane subunit [Ferrovibrio sp.]